MHYLDIGAKLLQENPQSRTLHGLIDGQKIWFKQATPPKARIWHYLQRGLSIILPLPILRSTVSAGGETALRAETARMIFFKEQGFHVPEVLASNSQMFAMTDLGPQFREVLDNAAPDDYLPLLKKAIQTMARLHRAGLAHGRPYMRDMTWDGEQIGFLDLEEDPLHVMPLPAAQARDVWIFLSAASRYARRRGEKTIFEGPLIGALYDEYAAHGTPETLAELRRFVLFLRPLRRLLDRKIFWNHIGQDARQAVYVNRCLEASLIP